MENEFSKILNKYWGYESFRPLQLEIITSIYNGKDTLGLMPTGGGKSITFQVPALAKKGICLVVTPLIALMKDQVEGLNKKGIKAAAIYSGMSYREIIITLENCIFGDFKFLYISPERLQTDLFLSRIEQLDVSMITVDESHCISQWGYDFRPSYLKISEIRELKPEAPILALTATATPKVVDDIQEKLCFKKKNVFQTSFKRPNLAYKVIHTENKYGALLELLNANPGSAIVYVRSRKKTQEISDLLNKSGIDAIFYHAGIDRITKDRRQTEWTRGDKRVIVATNAFGMGIDKPDVRLVIHTDTPNSPEAYFQEAGRAGRDGLESVAYLLIAPPDKGTLKRRISENFPEKDFIRKVYMSLGNYLQVALGSGEGINYEFELGKFCNRFKLPILQTHNALQILQHLGLIQVNDDRDNRSRLHFIASKEDIYYFEQRNPHSVDIVKTTLRSYSGLFSSYVYINEQVIAERSATSRDQVYNTYVNLDKAKLISYIPQKDKPTINYLQPRFETHLIVIRPESYEHRQERFRERVEAMLDYMEKSECRSKQLLIYFGETDAKECGKCDVCLKKSIPAFKDSYGEIKTYVLQALADSPQTLSALTQKSSFPDESLIKAIRFLEDNGLVERFGGQSFRAKIR